MTVRYPPPGEPQTFADLLAANRASFGSRLAYQEKARGQWRRVTHDEVSRRSEAFAAGFLAAGLEPGERVVIVLENGIDWVCAFYGAVLAGGIAVPIYYDLKTEEVTGMLDRAGPTMAVVGADNFDKVNGHVGRMRALVIAGDDGEVGEIRARVGTSPPVLSLVEMAGRGNDDSRDRLRSIKLQADDLACIIFTSGTSGGHKGVKLTHRNLMANLAQARRSIPLGASDRMLNVLPLHHAFPLIVCLAVAPAVGCEVTLENDLRRVRDRMAEAKPTAFMGVPALYEVMHRNVMQNISSQGRLPAFRRAQRIATIVKRLTGVNIGKLLFRELHRRLGGEIRFMVSGGAALPSDLQLSFFRLGIPLLQGWGLTEASPVLAVQRWSWWRFYLTRYYERRLGSIGPAIEGVDVRLVDVPEKGLLVGVHGEGELVASGENITPGYWQAPELDSDLKIDGWLRTGDLGRIARDGNIWITGRSKFIIVLDSGEKVYPEEVEERYATEPLLDDLVVRATRSRGDTRVGVVAYPNRDAALAELAGQEPTPEAVRRLVEAAVRRAERGIAAYKRASQVLLTDEPLPRTPLRKVMRGQLRDAYTFDPATWERTWAEHAESTAEPGAA